MAISLIIFGIYILSVYGLFNLQSKMRKVSFPVSKSWRILNWTPILNTALYLAAISVVFKTKKHNQDETN